jgi:large subunit ribosomal protein L17
MAAHRKATLRSMAGSLFKYERITTTKTKAQEVRRFAEKLITRAKVDSVHNRRIASSKLFDEGIVAKLFTDIGPRMKDRNGGYTRILKLYQRPGDAAEMVILELVDYKLPEDDKDKKAAAKKEKGQKGEAKAEDGKDSAKTADSAKKPAKKASAKPKAPKSTAKVQSAKVDTKRGAAARTTGNSSGSK